MIFTEAELNQMTDRQLANVARDTGADWVNKDRVVVTGKDLIPYIVESQDALAEIANDIEISGGFAYDTWDTWDS